MTTVRLAVGGPPDALAKGLAEAEDKPGLLVSYVYLKQFLRAREKYGFRDWVMDSGAFSAHNSGKTITLQSYIDVCSKLKATDPQLTEIFSLDVIGDYKAGLANVKEMWRQGIEAIPTWHPGEPWGVLTDIAAEYPKIAIGGLVRLHPKEKKRILDQVFARVWPKKLHGFGIASEEIIMRYPFDSVDASNWELMPTAFGRWSAYGKAQLSIKGSSQNLRAEVEHFLRMEARARDRWRGEMKLLGSTAGPTVRLATARPASASSTKPRTERDQ